MYGPSSVHVTASTGLAASNLAAIASHTSTPTDTHTTDGDGDGDAGAGCGACTLHSFAGVGLAYADRHRLVQQVEENGAAARRWRGARALVIDEISMVGPGLFVSGRGVGGLGGVAGDLKLVLRRLSCLFPLLPRQRGTRAGG